MDKPHKIALGCLFLQSLSVFAAEEATKPNIILIMTDQQSYNMISALQDTYTSTPNIDRLVKNGISFTNTLCANPVSVASRFSIFTGLYGGQYKVRDNQCDSAVQSVVVPVLAKYGMGNIFKSNGYQTVYGGKVHLPFAKNTNKFAIPVNYGFDTYLTTDERDILGTTAADFISKRTSTTPLLLVVSFLNPHDICLESSTNLSSDVYVDPNKPEIAATINAIRAEADAYDSTYFYDNLAPQLPFNYARTNGFPSKFTPSVFDNFPEYYWRRYRWIYSKLVELVDTHIGKVLDAIDNWSQKNNTIVVFTADHGEMQGAHHATVKNLPYDECQHVPLIFSGKGIVTNERDNSLVCNGTDIIPTLCELAGITPPAGLPGISLAKRTTGTGEVTQRKYLYLEGDGFSQIIENSFYKYTSFVVSGTNQMLIDLQNDPGELNNVYNSNATYSGKTNELSSILSENINKNQKIVTQIGETGFQKQIKIFPNPARDFLQVSSDEGTGADFKIFSITGIDMSGKVVLTQQSKSSFVFNLNGLPKGCYILKNRSETSMFIIN